MKKIVGAGVLCAAQDPVTNEVLVLLGREREVPGWKHGSRKWCGFSGRAEEGESALASAAREFVEESCGAVALSATASLPARVDEVRQELKRAPTFAHTVRAPPPSEVLLCHVTFMCRVPFDATVSERFARVHAELLELDFVFRAFHRAKKVAEHVPKVFLPGQSVADRAVNVDFRADAGACMVEVDLFDAHRGEEQTWRFRTSQTVADETAALSEAWRKVKHYVGDHGADDVFRHPAVLLSYCRGALVSAYVNKCYLEKTEVKWHSLASLEGLERWRGADDFRKHFLDNLKQLASTIRALFDEPG